MLVNLLLTIGSLIFSFGFVFAQNDTINQLDSLGKKQGYWVYYGKDRPSAGFPKNGKIEEGHYINGRKNGVWTKYHNDGKTPKLKGEYKNNRPNGRYAKFHRNNKVKEEGSFYRKIYSGIIKRFHENGELAYFGKFNEDGKPIDTTFHFFENGCLEFMFTFKPDGTPNSSYLYYPDSCNVIKQSEERTVVPSKDPEYHHRSSDVVPPRSKVSSRYASSKMRESYSDFALCSGEDLTLTKQYNENGEIKFDGMCKDGKVWDGKMYFYDNDGILLVVEIWKNGVYNSNGQL